MHYLEIAAKMLGFDDVESLPIVLKRDLDEINELCGAAGGSLHSRQAIAIAILDFAYRNPELDLKRV